MYFNILVILLHFTIVLYICTDSDGESSDEAPKKKRKSRGEPTFNKAAFSMPDGKFAFSYWLQNL